MKPIRHLIALVFLLCGLTAQGSGRVYDHYDMAGTYKYEIQEYVLNLHLHTDNTFMIVADDSSRRFGRWNVDEDIILLHFDRQEQDSTLTDNDLRRYVAKELEIVDKNTLFWGFSMHDGYEKRVILTRHDTSGSSRKRKGKNDIWKSLIEQAVREVIG